MPDILCRVVVFSASNGQGRFIHAILFYAVLIRFVFAQLFDYLRVCWRRPGHFFAVMTVPAVLTLINIYLLQFVKTPHIMILALHCFDWYCWRSSWTCNPAGLLYLWSEVSSANASFLEMRYVKEQGDYIDQDKWMFSCTDITRHSAMPRNRPLLAYTKVLSFYQLSLWVQVLEILKIKQV